MKYYHAAPPEVMEQILNDGVIKASWDGFVYLCKKPEEAARFVAIRGYHNIDVIEVDLNENEVQESHDHSETFFGCKAYVYMYHIKVPEKAIIRSYIANE